jgi:hypothetical protein
LPKTWQFIRINNGSSSIKDRAVASRDKRLASSNRQLESTTICTSIHRKPTTSRRTKKALEDQIAELKKTTAINISGKKQSSTINPNRTFDQLRDELETLNKVKTSIKINLIQALPFLECNNAHLQ